MTDTTIVVFQRRLPLALPSTGGFRVIVSRGDIRYSLMKRFSLTKRDHMPFKVKAGRPPASSQVLGCLRLAVVSRTFAESPQNPVIVLAITVIIKPRQVDVSARSRILTSSSRFIIARVDGIGPHQCGGHSRKYVQVGQDPDMAMS